MFISQKMLTFTIDYPTRQDTTPGFFYVGRFKRRRLRQKFPVDTVYTRTCLSTSPDKILSFGIATSGFLSYRRRRFDKTAASLVSELTESVKRC